MCSLSELTRWVSFVCFNQTDSLSYLYKEQIPHDQNCPHQGPTGKWQHGKVRKKEENKKWNKI